MSRSSIALLATGAAVVGGSIWYAREKKGAPLLSSAGTYANPLPVASSDAAAKRVPAIAARLKRLWPEVTGESGEMPKAALEIALSQAWLESGVAEAGGGGWWTDKTSKGQGDMTKSGNLGARQCGGNDKGGDYYTCVPYGDSMPQADGSQKIIDASFRFYKAGMVGGKQRDAGDAAAYDFLVSLIKQWPALAELKSGDVLAYAMRQGPKYRTSDPPNQRVFGREYKGGNNYYGGFGATMEERVGGYARAIASHIPAVAAALGHDRVYSRIVPEILSGKQHIYTKAERTMTAGVEIEGAGTIIAAIAGILVLLGISVVGYSAGKAIVIVKRIHDAGFVPVPPGGSLESGFVSVNSSDPDLVKAVGNDAILRALVKQGWSFQRKATTVAGEADVTADSASASDAYAQKHVAGIEGAGTVVAVVGAGLVAGALAAAALKRAKGASAAAPPPSPPVPAPSAPKAIPAPPKPPSAAKPPAVSNPRPRRDDARVDQGPSGIDAIDELARKAAQQRAADDAKSKAPGEGVWKDGKYTLDPDEPAPKKDYHIEPAVDGIAGTGAGFAAGLAAGGAISIATVLVHNAMKAARIDTPAIVPEPPPPIPPAPAPQPRTYTVRADDSPFKIAVKHGASKRGDWWKELAKANPQKETKGVAHGWKQLLPGETIIIPADWPARTTIEGWIGDAGPLSDDDLSRLSGGGIYTIDSKLFGGAPIPWPDPAQQEKDAPGVREDAELYIGKDKFDAATSAGIIFTRQIVPNTIVARSGDTPWKIAQRAGGKKRRGWWSELRQANPNRFDDAHSWKALRTGERIIVPAQWASLDGAEDDAGDVLQALYLSGSLPRARAIPGSHGRVIWYIENTFSPMVTTGHVDETGRFHMDSKTGPYVDESGQIVVGPHTHPDGTEYAEMGKAKGEKPKEERSGVDDALATATDVSTAATGIISTVDAIKNIAKRHGTEEDPKARMIIKAWVEKHPILARFTSPDLRPFASVRGIEGSGQDPNQIAYEVIGGLVDSIGEAPWLRSIGVHSEGFIIAGVDEITGDVRAEIPADITIAGTDLQIPIVAHEIGDDPYPVGAIQDDIYNVTSSAAAGFLNIFVPGAGVGFKKTSDAFKHKIDVDSHHDPGDHKKKKHGHKTKGSAADKAKIADLESQLAASKAKLDTVREYVTKHKYIVRWTKPRLATVVESEPAHAPAEPAKTDKGHRTKEHRTALGPVIPAESGTGKGQQ